PRAAPDRRHHASRQRSIAARVAEGGTAPGRLGSLLRAAVARVRRVESESVTDAPTVRRALANAGLVPLDAQVLLAHVLKCDRAWLAAHAGDALPREAADAFFALAR